jgi:ketosteroid isomerase-like protein
MTATRLLLQLLALMLATFLFVGCKGAQSEPTSTSLPLIASPITPVAPPSTVAPSAVLQAESIAQQYASAFEERDVDKYFLLHSDDALYVDNGIGYDSKPAKVRLYVQELQALFRYVDSFQVKMTSHFISTDGRFVVLQGTYSDWGKSGFPTTVPIVIVVEIREGKIVQETAYYDGSPFRK